MWHGVHGQSYGLAKWTAATPFSVRFCFILKDFSVKLIVHIYLFAGKCAGHPFLNVLDLTPWGMSPWVSHVLPWKGYNFGGRKSTVERNFSDQGPTIVIT